MEAITATELQLLGCFGVEPELLDSGVPWCYNTATYLTEVGGVSITFIVAPSYRDVRITVACGGSTLFEFSSLAVADVQVIDEFGVDAVEVILGEGSWFRLQLRSVFKITQCFETTPN